MQRKDYSSGTKWEETVAYSRAVKIGNIIEVAGTTAFEDGKIVGIGDAYEQARCIFRIIERTLHEAGASLEDVIRTRMFVTDISRWEEIGKAHGEFFKNIKPVTTLVEVSALIHPDMLVEIEVSAIATQT